MPGEILIVAGEASGDLHGAELVRALHEQSREVALFGLGGSAMANAGVDLVARNETTGVTGIVEVLSHLDKIYQTFRLLISEAKRRRPSLAVLIDYPDFNLRLAPKLKRLGIPVMYYISPQIWAWRHGRIRHIRRYVDHMAVILPFEEEIYRAAGVPVTFVGHPLRDVVRPAVSRGEFFDAYGLDRSKPLVTLLPGSRRKEIAAHLPVLNRALPLLRGPWQAIILKAPTIERAQIEGAGLPIVEDLTYDALTYSDLVLTSCGTATLETALCGTPMIAFYKLAPLTYLLGKPLVRMHTYAMCNILAGRRVVPELIQSEFRPDRVAEEAEKILAGGVYTEDMRAGLADIAHRLGPPGASARAASIAIQMSS
ncbi:MAG: lipid-A-disaccharide synthase [Acidobacteria bacterium]|nr:lipid-A-disaccharide synthase [Acidobacteriota bacterium]